MSTVLPVNVAEVTRGVVDLFTADTRLEGAVIGRSEELSKETHPHGWIGVYRQRIQYPSRALGRGTGYRRTVIHLVIAVQHSHAASGADCEDALEGLVQIVGSVLLTDGSFNGMVDQLEDFEVQYLDYWRNSTGIYQQTALIFVSGSVNVSVLD